MKVEVWIKQLRRQLQRANYAYYLQDDPIMQDEVYDRLYRELQALEEKYPDFFDTLEQICQVN